MRRRTLLACLGLLLAAGFLFGQPEPDKELLAPHLESLNAKKKDTRLAAIKKIGAQGLAARAAAADLGKRMRDDPDAQVGGQAARALAQIGPAGVSELIEGVRHKKIAVRNRALWALGLIGPDAKEAVGALAEALNDPAPDLRVMAAYALGEMETAAKPAIPALCKALRDKNAKVRMQAALALRNIGADAVPSLQELLKDDDTKVKVEALQAITQIGGDAKAAVADLVELLHDEDATVRIGAADSLWSIGPAAKDAITPLTSVLRDKNGLVQQHAFQAILRVGSADVPGLLETMRKLNADTHWAFPYILRQFGAKAKDAVRPLIKQLESPDVGQRMSAALALGEIGKEARDAIPALKKALKDKNPMVRHSAAFGLWRMNAGPADIGKQFAAAVEQIDEDVRKAVTNVGRIQRFGATVDLTAFNDPQFQAPYNTIIDLHLLFSAQKNMVSAAATNPNNAGPNLSWLAAQDLQKSALAASDALMKKVEHVIDAFPPEAVPAIIRGMHLAAYYQLGFC